MNRKFLILAGISGALAVALGAMGAHALKNNLPAENLQTYETAVKYQFYHTLALLLVYLLLEKNNSTHLRYAAAFFVTGIILFSFSLYFLALRPLLSLGNEELMWVGAITPLGGLSFITAWVLVFLSALKK